MKYAPTPAQSTWGHWGKLHNAPVFGELTVPCKSCCPARRCCKGKQAAANHFCIRWLDPANKEAGKNHQILLSELHLSAWLRSEGESTQTRGCTGSPHTLQPSADFLPACSLLQAPNAAQQAQKCALAVVWITPLHFTVSCYNTTSPNCHQTAGQMGTQRVMYV